MSWVPRHFGPLRNRPDATSSITIPTVAQFLSAMQQDLELTWTYDRASPVRDTARQPLPWGLIHLQAGPSGRAAPRLPARRLRGLVVLLKLRDRPHDRIFSI